MPTTLDGGPAYRDRAHDLLMGRQLGVLVRIAFYLPFPEALGFVLRSRSKAEHETLAPRLIALQLDRVDVTKNIHHGRTLGPRHNAQTRNAFPVLGWKTITLAVLSMVSWTGFLRRLRMSPEEARSRRIKHNITARSIRRRGHFPHFSVFADFGYSQCLRM